MNTIETIYNLGDVLTTGATKFIVASIAIEPEGVFYGDAKPNMATWYTEEQLSIVDL